MSSESDIKLLTKTVNAIRQTGKSLSDSDSIAVVNLANQHLKTSLSDMLDLSSPETYVFGCIRGDIKSLLMQLREIENKSNESPTFIFLGNFTGREKNSIEVTVLLCCLQLLHPKQYFVLKGRYETSQMSSIYGISREATKRKTPEIIKPILDYFDRLPECAKLNQEVYCTSLGIRNQSCDQKDQQLWNEYSPDIAGWNLSTEDNQIFTFGNDILNQFLSDVNCSLCLSCARTPPSNYRSYDYTHPMLSLWSNCTDISEFNNPSAVLVVRQSEPKFVVNTYDRKGGLIISELT